MLLHIFSLSQKGYLSLYYQKSHFDYKKIFLLGLEFGDFVWKRGVFFAQNPRKGVFFKLGYERGIRFRREWGGWGGFGVGVAWAGGGAYGTLIHGTGTFFSHTASIYSRICKDSVKVVYCLYCHFYIWHYGIVFIIDDWSYFVNLIKKKATHF